MSMLYSLYFAGLCIHWDCGKRLLWFAVFWSTKRVAVVKFAKQGYW